ncbi:hypothetical protein QFZ53_001504 [Microbacterium natoriense]|uniref:Uncharacterized protein n=1 Tax=Microbacterium natoriense TaxID=284570 RepID=A0AAW8EUZ1_9MICO|nr:hypothetical protein [Microbacterium natoriense]MDQ0647308.1 hypothetical protein [Microbacterium natoriense]
MTGRFELTLAFQKTTCDRCGGDRLYSEQCTACGRKPHFAETQPQVQRRHRTVQLFREQRDTVEASWEDAEQLLRDAGTMIDTLAVALEGVANGGEDPAPLIEAFYDLDKTVAAWSQPHPRPRRNRARTIGRALERLRDASETFTEALTAPTAHLAQELARRGQEAFAAASEHLGRLSEYNKYTAFDANDAGSLITKIMESTRDELHDPTLTELDAALRQRHRLSTTASSGAGIELDLYRPAIVLALDEERVDLVVPSVERAFTSELMIGMVANAEWAEEHGRVTALLSMALTTAFVDLEERSDLQTADRLLDVVLKLKEGHVRHLLATMLHLRGGSYAALRKKPTGAIFKEAESRFPELQLGGLNRVLRNAAGHSDFNVDDSGVTVRDNGVLVTLPVSEFLNDVLVYFELSIMLQVGIVRACAELDIGLPASRHTSNSDRRTAIIAIASAIGWKEVQVTELLPVCRMSARATTTQFIHAGYALARVLPDDTESLHVVLHDEDGVHQGVVDILGMKGADLSGNVLTVEGALQMARVAASHRVDGASAMSPQEWAALAHAIALDSSTSVIGRLRGLRALRETAAEFAMLGLEAVVGSLATRLRGEVGTPRMVPSAPSGTAFAREANQRPLGAGHFGGHFGRVGH